MQAYPEPPARPSVTRWHATVETFGGWTKLVLTLVSLAGVWWSHTAGLLAWSPIGIFYGPVIVVCEILFLRSLWRRGRESSQLA
jgi:hypothetical protein